MLDHLRRLYAYEHWANAEVLRSVLATDDPPERAVRRFAHVIGAQWLWLGRIEGAAAPAVVWPDLDPRACREQLEALRRRWSELLAGLDADGLRRDVAYVNSKGEPWTSTVGDILTHVLLHSSYHRGQIAADLASAGAAPAYTDFIHAVRRGLLEVT